MSTVVVLVESEKDNREKLIAWKRIVKRYSMFTAPLLRDGMRNHHIIFKVCF